MSAHTPRYQSYEDVPEGFRAQIRAAVDNAGDQLASLNNLAHERAHEIERLERVNAELLGALETIVQGLRCENDLTDTDLLDVASAAIAQAKGEG